MSSRAAIACLLGIGLMAAGCDRKSPAPEQATPTPAANIVAASDEATAPAAPAAPAQKLDRSHKGETPPALAFTDPEGQPVTLAAFRGKPVLLNLWATWCAPCVAEMPTLDAAAERLKGRVAVLAVSQDLDGKAKVAPFFAAHAFKALTPYLDPKLGLSLAYRANLPTTILIDSTGHEVWRMTGGNAWNTPEAAKLIAEAS
ncbi:MULTISPECIES: TlpA disulfide reductase family protein [unclassified Sphingomonas]|uniref:TlpA family protein disulfide reductase n=1 Tax=unclassified Sphingomonas TaxID=196159 RepID=UPI00226A8484|nr:MULTISPECIES: TlpA disulfide reductase family protein [unclassified Sphingomonas]